MPNGLTALLIADTDSKTENHDTEEESTVEESTSENVADSDDDEYSDMSDSEDECFEEKMVNILLQLL